MRVVKLTLLWIIGLIILLFLWLYLSTAWAAYQNYRTDLNSYMGLKIGASREEAIYVFGYPDQVIGDGEINPSPELEGEWARMYDVTGNDPVNAMPKGKTINDYDEWSFNKDGYRVEVEFDKRQNKVETISCMADDGEGVCPGIMGIVTGDDEDAITNQLGKADLFQYVGTSKSYRWLGLGIDVSLVERKAYMVKKHAAKGASASWLLNHIFL